LGPLTPPLIGLNRASYINVCSRRGVSVVIPWTALKTTATGQKSGVGATFFRRFSRLWKLGFPSWYSAMVRPLGSMTVAVLPLYLPTHTRAALTVADLDDGTSWLGMLVSLNLVLEPYVPSHHQALRFYLQAFLSFIAGALTTYLSIIVVPTLTMAVVEMDKTATAITFAWGMASFIVVSMGLAFSLYLGERLALDWRRSMMRRVRVTVDVCFLLPAS
jgi:hypothetical protein